MGFVSGLFGGICGVGCQLMSNGIQKIPLSRRPWLHVICFITGCYVGDQWPKLEQKLVDDINKERAEQGLPPIIGTSGWIKYRLPEEEEMAKIGSVVRYRNKDE